MRLIPGGPVLVFGGSFDPPTLAHSTLPPRAAESIAASRLILVPAAVSPHKTDTPPTAAKHRLAMLRLATSDIDGVEIDTRELDRGGVSRTIDTLESLRDEIDPSLSLRLLIGTDQVRAFDRWYRWQDIVNVAEPVVMVRGDDDPAGILADIRSIHGEAAAAQWERRMLNLPRMNQTSTRVRAAAADFGDDVTETVASYIALHRLYQ